MPSNAYYIPNGPANLAPLFPALNFDNVRDYYIQVLDNTAALLASSTLNVMTKLCEDDLRIHFVNLSGAIDSAIVKLTDVEHDTKSDIYQAAITNPLVKNAHAMNRINLKANNTYKTTLLVLEDQMDWVQELLDTPYAWLEWTGTQGQSNDYLPIVLLDSKIPLRKDVDRYEYEIPVIFMLSHEKMILSA